MDTHWIGNAEAARRHGVRPKTVYVHRLLGHFAFRYEQSRHGLWLTSSKCAATVSLVRISR